jgi:hypothetical protein
MPTIRLNTTMQLNRTERPATPALIIESRDGRFRATACDTAEGVRFRLLRYAGPTDGPGGNQIVWRVIESGTIDVPFHVACDQIERLVFALEDDRRARGRFEGVSQ